MERKVSVRLGGYPAQIRAWPRAGFLLVLLACTPLFCAFAGQDIIVLSQSERFSVNMGFSISVNNTFNFSSTELNTLEAILPLPQSDYYQEVKHIRGDRGHIKKVPETGDQYCYYYRPVKRLSLATTFFSEQKFEIVLSAVRADFDQVTEQFPYKQNSYEYKRYTGYNDEYIMPKHGRINRLAQEISPSSRSVTHLEFARKAYSYLLRNFSYKNTPDIPKMETVLDRGYANTMGLCSIFISLLRNRSIPARHVTGLGLTGEKRAIAEFFLEGYGWIPVDIDRAFRSAGKDYFGRIYKEDAFIVTGHDINVTVQIDNENRKVKNYSEGYFYWTRSALPPRFTTNPNAPRKKRKNPLTIKLFIQLEPMR